MAAEQSSVKQQEILCDDNQSENSNINILKLSKTWTSNEQHDAGDLKRTLHGNDYQLKLLMLFALKGKNSQVSFHLATEMAEAEKFDDVVFRYTDSKGNIKYRFLQAKHKQLLEEKNKIKFSHFKSNSNDFSLQKYFDSYLNVIGKNKFQDGVVEDFIICTNTDFDFKLSTTKKNRQITIEGKNRWKNYFTEKTDDDEILNFGGKRYQFSNDPIVRREIISELKPIFQKTLERNKLSNDNVDEINDFLDKLVLAVQQPSGVILEQKIKDTIGNEYNLINDIVFEAFYKYMYDWMIHRIKTAEEKGDGKAHFITHTDIKQFLTENKKKIASLGLISSTLLCKRKIEKLGLRFKGNNTAVQKINTFLSKKDSDKQILILCSKTELLTEIKVFQIFASDANKDRYIFSDLKSLSLLVGSSADPVSAFSSQGKDYLIIENLSELDKYDETLLKFYKIVLEKQGSNKKIILISQPEQKDKIKNLFKNDAYVEIIEDGDNKLADLTPQSKDKIIETEVTLFGKKRKLTELTTDASKNDLYLDIDEEALNMLINSDSTEIIIGSEDKYEFDTYVDIPRTLTYQTNIDKKCLEENNNDLFAICGINKTKFCKLVPTNYREFVDEDPAKEKGDPIRFIRLDNQRDVKKDFDKICRDYKEFNIHLLEYKNSALEWKQSHGSLTNLRRHLLSSTERREQINNISGSAIIAGEPGIGKSTILTTYAIKTNSIWNIRVHLKDKEYHISNADFSNLNGIIEFFSIVIDPTMTNSAIIKGLLKYCLKQQGQVTILLDGYDEIKESIQEKVVQLLRTLKTTRGKVLITTRLYARSELEDALGIFAYTLNSFEEEEQKQFLKHFWIGRLEVKEPAQEEKIDDFTGELLTNFHSLNLMTKDGLVGIVLQARMVAEIFQDVCKEYIEYEEFNFSDYKISNIFDLYENFIEFQYKRYLNEKIEVSSKLSDESQTSLSRSYTKAYGDLALKSLFSKDQIQELFRKETFLKKELKGVGLIKTFKDDGTAVFLHPTYAEYFAADFLVDILRKEEDHPKYRAVHNFLLILIFRGRNKVIRDFIESAIKKGNNQNLKDKWKAIHDCDLLGEKKPKEAGLLSGKQHNVLPLKEILPIFKEATPRAYYRGKYGHYYNYAPETSTKSSSGPSLISDLFYSFDKEKNVKILQHTLDYLVTILNNGGLHYYIKNDIILYNLHKAIYHYLVVAKQQDKLDLAFVKKIDKDKSYAYIYNSKLKDISEKERVLLDKFITASNENQKKLFIQMLKDFFIPNNVIALNGLSRLNTLYCLLDKKCDGIIKKISLYINSDKSVQKMYKNSVIDLLKNIAIPDDDNIDEALKPLEFGKSLQSFFIDITHHPNIIEDTKSSLNEIYKEKSKSSHWIEKQDVLICRFLKILTLEMSEAFISVFDVSGNILNFFKSGHICSNLIDHILDTVKTEGIEGLPQINKLAFLKIITCFTKFNIDRRQSLTFDRLETILAFIGYMLNKPYISAHNVLESIECLHVLGETGLKLISTDQKLLVLDPASEFQYELSSDYKTQIVELIKWRRDHPDQPRGKFLEKCFEVLELNKNNLKRKGSDSNLLEVKRLKVENYLYEDFTYI